ncbi:MAG: restriction endonuclease subunit S [Myxococcales bacterium]|nr:restriction endonuclease subunit S [Myxococcales bacterium]
MSSKTNTTATKEEARPALVPKLRFQEFRGAEGWPQESGDSLFDQINDRNSEPGLPVLAITQEHGAIPRHMIDYHVSVTEKSIESYKVVGVGDFIISLRSFQGGIEYSRYHGICSPAYVILRRRGKGSDEYFRHYLKTDRFIRILTKNLEGLRDGKMISYAQFSELRLPTPKPAEQQKIADCLSSVDELMAAQARKVDALKTHKKGLMQQLFPREGETQPRRRFPEFQNASEWEETSFGRVLKISSGKGFKASEYSKTGIRLLQIENVGYGSTKWSENTSYLPESYATEYPELVLRGGDIVLALNRPVTNDELKIAKIQHHEPIAILYQRVGRLEFLDDSLQVDFAFHVCRQFIKEFVVEKSIGSDQPFISLKDLYSQSFRLPGPAEQQRIATCLSSLDALITAETQKLEALKTHKKGLMQQLFPSPEEVAA